MQHYLGELAMANQRPNPNKAFPNPKIPSLCYIKNVVKNPRIIIGDYTYYDELIELLHQFKWWDKSIEDLESLMPILSCGDLEKVKMEIKARL